jgi:GDPmannose 4,6-dehydratase
MRLMLQADRPGEYVVATGRSVTVQEFCRIAFAYVGLDWREYVSVDPQINRPAEVPALCGNAAKVRAELGWQPTTTLEDLIAVMVEADLKRVKDER